MRYNMFELACKIMVVGMGLTTTGFILAIIALIIKNF